LGEKLVVPSPLPLAVGVDRHHYRAGCPEFDATLEHRNCSTPIDGERSPCGGNKGLNIAGPVGLRGDSESYPVRPTEVDAPFGMATAGRKFEYVVPLVSVVSSAIGQVSLPPNKAG